jgi:hypothetical protein
VNCGLTPCQTNSPSGPVTVAASRATAWASGAIASGCGVVSRITAGSSATAYQRAAVLGAKTSPSPVS